MQIFFSHSSTQKPLIREIRKTLPDHINIWIDEEKLLLGDAIDVSLEVAIKKETDYILLFIDTSLNLSKWMEKEILWALEQERILDRILLLPIVICTSAWETLTPAIIKERKYLKLEDYTETSVRTLSKKITSELFSLICRDIQNLRNPARITKASVLENTDKVLNEIATLIRHIVFSYRESKPIEVAELLQMLSNQSGFRYSLDDFDILMRKIIQNDLIPGLAYDGFELYLKEEHYKWKSEIAHDAKMKVAKLAASMIKSGHKVGIDAGSTTDEVARILCKRLETKSLSNIVIVTTSISVANIFLETGTRLGYDDDSSAFTLYIAGGRVRCNTLAVIDDEHTPDCQLQAIMDKIGGVDVSVVGVNGIDWTQGFTTHENSETRNKKCLLDMGKIRLILGDTSKIGIVREVPFCSFEDDVFLIINDGGADPKFVDLLEKAQSKMRVAK